MKIRKVPVEGVEIAVVDSREILIHDTQSALDLIATVSYEVGCDRMIVDKSAVCEDFFDLRSGVAGEVLQKFINYRAKLAIVGDFSKYASKSLKDFIYECNQGRDIFFVADEGQAIERLCGV